MRLQLIELLKTREINQKFILNHKNTFNIENQLTTNKDQTVFRTYVEIGFSQPAPKKDIDRVHHIATKNITQRVYGPVGDELENLLIKYHPKTPPKMVKDISQLIQILRGEKV